jgi:hypothetical protein
MGNRGKPDLLDVGPLFREWPPTASRFTHAMCFAEEKGVAALIDAVHGQDLRMREPMEEFRKYQSERRKRELTSIIRPTPG